MTPEGKVKKKVRELLADARFQPVRAFWPVPGGYGEGSVDVLVCVRGRFIAIEVKAEAGDKPTARQAQFMRDIEDAGGLSLLVAGLENVKRLEDLLEAVCRSGG